MLGGTNEKAPKHFAFLFIIVLPAMENGVIDDPPEVKRSAAPGDWVKDLFAPIFDFDAIIEAGKQSPEPGRPHIKRAAILDPQAVREVFERVHQRVLDSERLKREELEKRTGEVCHFYTSGEVNGTSCQIMRYYHLLVLSLVS